MRGAIVALCAVLGVAGCGQSASEATAKSEASAAPAKPKRPAYCFFKDEETKGWSASVDAAGNVTVKGKAHIKDSRYSAQLGTAEIEGTAARIAPSISPNTTGYASPDNWWDVKATIPQSAAVDTVIVECGKKQLAELKVTRR
jgi:hypothetical protein